VKYLKKSGNAHKFLLQGTRHDIVNALRRSIVGHIQTLAIEKVMIYKNESVMPDEFLAHRLGLVPINARDFNDTTEFSLSLEKTGGVVKSGDIETNGLVDIPYKNIPLVKLNDKKKLELELVALTGTGDMHIKWNPALVYFNNVPSIKTKGKVDEKLAKLCMHKLIEIKAGKAVLSDPYNCDACRYCCSVSDGVIEMDMLDDEFVFTIEPYGNLDVDLIISGAVDYLQKELSELEDQIGKLK